MNLLRTNFYGFENTQDIINTYPIISDISVVKRDLPHYNAGANPGVYLHTGYWRNHPDYLDGGHRTGTDIGPPYLTYGPGAYGGSDKKNIPLQATNIILDISNQRQKQYSDETWNYLYELSLETFVEESEEKKLSGAGAGLTDND